MSKRSCVALLAGLSLVLCSSITLADGSGKWVSGEETYQKVCAYCHEAGVSPYLLGRQFPAAVTTFTVRNGSRAMPAFKPSFIDDAALKALAEYIEKAPAGPNAPKVTSDTESSETRIVEHALDNPAVVAARTHTPQE